MDVCAYLGDERRAGSLYELMHPHARDHAVIGSPVAETYLGSFAMRLGMLATLLCRHADAERHFRSAIDWADAAGTRPWLAHTRIEYARMLLARGESGDPEAARKQLRGALDPAREMGMQAVVREANALEAKAFPER